MRPIRHHRYDRYLITICRNRGGFETAVYRHGVAKPLRGVRFDSFEEADELFWEMVDRYYTDESALAALEKLDAQVDRIERRAGKTTTPNWNWSGRGRAA